MTSTTVSKIEQRAEILVASPRVCPDAFKPNSTLGVICHVTMPVIINFTYIFFRDVFLLEKHLALCCFAFWYINNGMPGFFRPAGLSYVKNWGEQVYSNLDHGETNWSKYMYMPLYCHDHHLIHITITIVANLKITITSMPNYVPQKCLIPPPP